MTTPTDNPVNSDPHYSDGVFVMLDVVGFSKLQQHQQVYVVRRLWDFLGAHPTITGNPRALVNCTGDGMLFACPADPEKVREQDIVELVRGCMDHMRGGDPSAHLRAGIHRGPYTAQKLPGLERPQAIGSGPNECARICSIGDAGHVVVSDWFCTRWAVPQPGALNLFKHKDGPFSVPVKHGVQLNVRLYVGGTATDGDAPPPERISTLDLVESRLFELLAELEEFFLQFLIEHGGKKAGITSKVLRPRISIFGVDLSGKPMLRPTTFRYCRHDTRKATGRGTSYSAHQPCEGPVGMAYISRGVVAINDLPDPVNEFPKYARRLEKKFNLEKDKVQNFAVMARSFVAFPFGLSDNEKAPIDGVVCVDTLSPLSHISHRNLCQVGEDLWHMYKLVLAGLYRLRA